ncbi:MAG: S8 family serine peptidase [Myxococcales bacterium]|nr:S8 family serine peptidase [Myxococcales bacterium]
MTAPLALLVALAAAASEKTVPLVPRPEEAAERLLSQGLPPSLDGRLGFAYLMARREGHPPGGLHRLLGQSVDALGIQVTVRFVSDVTEEDARALGRAGCRPDRLDSGAPASVGPVVAARCGWEGLWQAAGLRRVARISPTFDYRVLRPLAPPADNSAREVEAYQLSEAFYPDGHGKGVVICDMDSGVDPLHPFFFRADGGAFPWLDMNGNGSFDPLLDAVDFNRNGVKDSGEALGVLKSSMLWIDWYSGQQTLYNDEPAFLAGHDWLFQDENGDGARNQGRSAPYGDSKPTFGEQLFLADDVNRNGRLDVGERVIRLNTPKIRAVRTPPSLTGPPQVFRRGQNLAQTPEAHPGAYEHGTMVLGTLGGGVADLTRYAGVAPDAELLLASSRSKDLVSDLSWALSEGAKVVLWEMATWYGEFLDGSDNLEAACDAASDQGVLQMGAAGNLGGSEKHRVMTHGAGTQSVPLVIPSNQAGYVYGDFLWRQQAGAVLSFKLSLGGTTLTLAGTGQTTAGNLTVQWGTYSSPRQTNMMLFYLSAPQGSFVSGQTATFEVTNSGAPVALHGYVADDFSGWGKGAYWPSTTGSTDLGTYGTPGTGDKTLSVATYFSELLPSGAPKGALATYSGRGPRIDGADSVDFAAPEDHVTALVGSGAPLGAMWIGGGTSNALPVAAGAAAALWGVRPAATPVELSTMLRTYALAEPGMGAVPNDAWGRGKVRAYRAQFSGTAAPANQPPSAAGSAKRVSVSALDLDASASSDPEGSALRYRWDLDYDGSWDLGPMSGAKVTTATPEPNVSWVKLEIADDKGKIAQAILRVLEAGDGGTAPDGGSLDAGAAGDGGSSTGRVLFFSRAPSQLGGPPGCGCSEGPGLSLLAAAALVLSRPRRRERQPGL